MESGFGFSSCAPSSGGRHAARGEIGAGVNAAAVAQSRVRVYIRVRHLGDPPSVASLLNSLEQTVGSGRPGVF